MNMSEKQVDHSIAVIIATASKEISHSITLESTSVEINKQFGHDLVVRANIFDAVRNKQHTTIFDPARERDIIPSKPSQIML